MRFILMLLLSLAPTLLWASPYGFQKNVFSTAFETSYLWTTSNFDQTGGNARLPANNQLTEVKFDVNPAYDLSNWWGVYGHVTVKKVDSYATTEARTNSGLSDITLGTDFLVFSKFLNIIPDISVSFPTYPKPGSNDAALLGDGAATVTGKVYLSKNFYSLSVGGFTGIQTRSEGLSTQIPWGLMARYEYNPIFYEAMFHGSASLNNDQYTKNPQVREEVTEAVNAGSLLYHAMNPSWIKLQGRFGWKVAARIHLVFGIEHVLFGVRTAQSTSIMGGLVLADIFDSARKAQKEKKGFTPFNSGEEGL